MDIDIMTLGTGITLLCLITLFIGALFGYFFWGVRNDKTEPEPPRIVESDVLKWERLEVSMEEAQRETP